MSWNKIIGKKLVVVVNLYYVFVICSFIHGPYKPTLYTIVTCALGSTSLLPIVLQQQFHTFQEQNKKDQFNIHGTTNPSIIGSATLVIMSHIYTRPNIAAMHNLVQYQLHNPSSPNMFCADI
jgi:hypothetical protein